MKRDASVRAGILNTSLFVGQAGFAPVTVAAGARQFAMRTIPQGFTLRQFRKFSCELKQIVDLLGLPEGEILIQGSRVKKTAAFDADIDVFLRVDAVSFSAYAAEAIVAKGGSRFTRKMLQQIVKQGRLDRFRTHPELGTVLEEHLRPAFPFLKKIDFSLVREFGGEFDSGFSFPLIQQVKVDG